MIRKCYSAASLSFFIFFKSYNSFKIEKCLGKVFDSFLRNAYYGGRAEVFGNIDEGEHIKYYDFPGMYAQCMLEKFHNGKFEYKLGADYKEPGFHTIKYVSKCDIPVLPCHNREGRLLFMNGTNEGMF